VVVISLSQNLRKVTDTIKLIIMVVLITVLLILAALNFQEKHPVNLIFRTIKVWPSLIIVLSFAMGMLFTALLVLIRRARKR